MRVGVIGAGPAGLTAALQLADAGVDVTLFDEQPSGGGQIYRHAGRMDADATALFGRDYAAGGDLVRQFEEAAGGDGLTYIAGATVWSVTEDGEVAWSIDNRSYSQHFEALVLATGALERAMPLPGWTNPGVLTVGAAQILMKTAGHVPKDAVLVGSGPLLYLVADQMLAMGSAPRALLETQVMTDYLRALPRLRPNNVTLSYLAKGLGMLRRLARAKVPRFTGVRDVSIIPAGDQHRVSFTCGDEQRQIDAGHVLLHAGVHPNIQLSQALGLTHHWNDVNECWEPETDRQGRTSKPGLYIAGDGAGILGADAARLSGELVAMAVLEDHGGHVDAARLAAACVRHKSYHAIRGFLDTLYAPKPFHALPADDTIICRCEEVAAGRVRSAVQLGCLGPNQLKAFSRCGMGNCQGRYCGLTVVNLIADTRGLPHADIGYYRIRTPIKPVTLEEIANHDIIH